MHVALVGLRGSGKTTVFNALTGQQAATGFAGKSGQNLGSIKVPDPRVEFLTQVHEPKKKTLAEIGFIDVPGSDSALDSSLLAAMRDADAIVHVTAGFPEYGGTTSLADQVAQFDDALLLSDQSQVEARIKRLQKEGKKDLERALLERVGAGLDAGTPLRRQGLSELELKSIAGFALLSSRPCLVLCNRGDDEVTASVAPDVEAICQKRGLWGMSLAARVEAEIAQLPAEEQLAFLQDLGLSTSARDRFIQETYRKLSLISFLTAGPDECRAWSIPQGTNAQRAAGKIHSDLERGFIRAEVIAFEDFRAHPSEAKCREVGKLRIEGKSYVVADGDILNIRFNV